MFAPLHPPSGESILFTHRSNRRASEPDDRSQASAGAAVKPAPALIDRSVPKLCGRSWSAAARMPRCQAPGSDGWRCAGPHLTWLRFRQTHWVTCRPFIVGVRPADSRASGSKRTTTAHCACGDGEGEIHPTAPKPPDCIVAVAPAMAAGGSPAAGLVPGLPLLFPNAWFHGMPVCRSLPATQGTHRCSRTDRLNSQWRRHSSP